MNTEKIVEIIITKNNNPIEPKTILKSNHSTEFIIGGTSEFEDSGLIKYGITVDDNLEPKIIPNAKAKPMTRNCSIAIKIII